MFLWTAFARAASVCAAFAWAGLEQQCVKEETVRLSGKKGGAVTMDGVGDRKWGLSCHLFLFISYNHFISFYHYHFIFIFFF